MKFSKFFKTAAVLGFIALLDSCGLEGFSRHYRQLDDDTFRPFSYQFKNPEIAPGDTVELSVIFNGKVSAENISWKVNWNYITNRFGSSGPVNGFEKPLKIISERIGTYDGHSQTATIRFVVPDSMLYNSYAIPASLEQMAAMYNFPNIPKIGFPTSKENILNMFENLSKRPLYLQQAFIDSLGINGTVIDGLAQIFSAMFEIYIDIPNIPRSKIRHTVRYHGKLSHLYGVYANTNPRLEIYFYQGSRSHYVWWGDTIWISLNRNQKAYLYFYPDNRDSAISLEKAFAPTKQGSVKVERFYTRWFFEGGETYSKLWFSDFSSEDETRPSYNEEDFVYNDSGYFSRIIYIDYDKANPGDTGYIFLVLFDHADGVVYRPQGRTTLGFPIKFVN